MIVVENPGTWNAIYSPLRHAGWHGWTLADLVFPFFLFIVGVAMTFSFIKRLACGNNKKKLYLKVFRRTLILFGLGLFLNAFPFFSLSSIRIPGVLQRIALCYFFTSIVILEMRIKWQAITAALLCVLYWAMLKLVPVPDYGAGIGNLVIYIDATLLRGHLLEPSFDPEGLLSTVPAISTTLAGALTGHWLHSFRSPMEKAAGLFVMGNFGIVLGLVMDIWFPINKPLWTSSYVIFTTGMALNCLGMCYWLIDVKGYRRWATPFVIYGVNAITVYIFSNLTSKIMRAWKLTQPDGSEIQMKTYIFEKLFASWANPFNASLFYALTYTLLWLIPMAILYRKKIFIKI
jgi:predicted acyltransferase